MLGGHPPALHADADRTGPIEGGVTIGAPESLCGHLLPPVIAALRRRHPGIEMTLAPAGTADALDGLRAGRFALALAIEAELAAPDLVLDRVSTLQLAFVSGRAAPVSALTWPDVLLARHRRRTPSRALDAVATELRRQASRLPGRPRPTGRAGGW